MYYSKQISGSATRRKFLLTALAFMVMLSAAMFVSVPQAEAASSNGITTSMIQAVCTQYDLKDGYYWRSATQNKWSSYLGKSVCTSGYKASKLYLPYEYEYANSYQCKGFARFLSSKITGSNYKAAPAKWKTWTLKTTDSLQPGDVLQTPGHDAVVYKVVDGKVYVAECLGGSNNKLKINSSGFNSARANLSLDTLVKRYPGIKVCRFSETVSPNGVNNTAEGEGPGPGPNGAISISNYITPGTQIKGKSFGLRGTIKSDIAISSMTGTIYNSKGKAVYTKTVKPNAKTCYIQNSYTGGNINNALVFNKLGKGSYTYKVTAINASNPKGKVLIDTKFTVIDGNITISGQTVPTTIKKGKCFGLRGTVKSDLKISSMTGTIYNSRGKAVYSRTVKPNTTTCYIQNSYSGGNINNSLLFNRLTKGTYTYKVTATNSNGTKTLINKKFTVK